MARFTDLAFVEDAEHVYDLAIDKTTRDLATTDGLESAVFVSFFSDARARDDEVAEPIKRRGWIGDLVAEEPDDVHGSKLWLYEQSRLTGEVVASLRFEAEAALAWMTPDLVKTVAATIAADGARRRAEFGVTLTFANGGRSTHSWSLAEATRTGTIARI